MEPSGPPKTRHLPLSVPLRPPWTLRDRFVLVDFYFPLFPTGSLSFLGCNPLARSRPLGPRRSRFFQLCRAVSQMTMCKLRAGNPVAHQPKLFSSPSTSSGPLRRSPCGTDLTRHARNVPQGQTRRERAGKGGKVHHCDEGRGTESRTAGRRSAGRRRVARRGWRRRREKQEAQ